MTHYTEFEKAVRHVRDCLFWDFVDGVWNDVIVTPLDRNYFNRLMQQVSDAHAREVEALNAENAKLRELAADMREAFIHGNCYRWCEFKEPCDGKCQYIDRMRELGVVE